jgi:cephalosporin hydroxylase
LLGHGSVITVDVEARSTRPTHPRITYITGSSIDASTVQRVNDLAAGARVMVILDSDHSKSHVLQEIELYAPFVQLGDYLIVEDTNINGHPTFPEYGAGPMEAVETFLAESDEFEVDIKCERFMLTFNPRGYLRRVKSAAASS